MRRCEFVISHPLVLFIYKQSKSISLILFLIYIRFLFSKIKVKFSEVQKLSYINDMTLYISEKTAEENVKVLQEAAKTVFT